MSIFDIKFFILGGFSVERVKTAKKSEDKKESKNGGKTTRKLGLRIFTQATQKNAAKGKKKAKNGALKK